MLVQIRWSAWLSACLVLGGYNIACRSEPIVLSSSGNVSLVFQSTPTGLSLRSYKDSETTEEFTFQGTLLEARFSGSQEFIPFKDLGKCVSQQVDSATFETSSETDAIGLRTAIHFLEDARTVRFHFDLKIAGASRNLEAVRFANLDAAGESFTLNAPKEISSPVFGKKIFLGIEHPVALCHAEGSHLSFTQEPCLEIGQAWTSLPSLVVGSCGSTDVERYGKEALRHAFIRYLDLVRVRPSDFHVHYNDWWTAPVPSSEKFVLSNIAQMKKALYDQTGFFFDSYAMDMGWSDPHSVWKIDKQQFPQAFDRIEQALKEVQSHPGLWVSPSSLYPPALDNHWLQTAAYEVIPHPGIGLAACLSRGNRYQQEFLKTLLETAKRWNLAHVKFDGYIPGCDVSEHGHPPGLASRQCLADGLIEIFDALRAQNPTIALEPTCFGPNASPWWLLHVPFIIGPFGDDSPRGRCPAPEWIEAMISGREVANLDGRNGFLMPSNALQCFDIVFQCPGDLQNMAVMAIGRGRWFISSYINPRYMEPDEWRFFALLMQWARAHRQYLQEPIPFGGHPAERKAYGYAFLDAEDRQFYCVRNPWMEETEIALPLQTEAVSERVIQRLYPYKQTVAVLKQGDPLTTVHLGPYETAFFEIRQGSGRSDLVTDSLNPAPQVDWKLLEPLKSEVLVVDRTPVSLGPSENQVMPEEAGLTLRLHASIQIEQARKNELCFLCEGSPEVSKTQCDINLDGQQVIPRVEKSEGSFSATGHPPQENWIWFLIPITEGVHEISAHLTHAPPDTSLAVYIRGAIELPPDSTTDEQAPFFPTYHPDQRGWSQSLVKPLSFCQAPKRTAIPQVYSIHGVFLDSMDWLQATAGWGEVKKNKSIQGKPLSIGGKTCMRGLGTHAPSEIRYSIPEGYTRFKATIGYDQEVSAGSIVFVVKGDDQELFRSPVIRAGSEPIAIDVPIAGMKSLSLILEDAGDGITADHGDWAEARIER